MEFYLIVLEDWAPCNVANKFMNISKMIVTICLLYKMLFTLGAFDFFVSSINMHVALGYAPKISITVFALHLAILVTGVQGHSIHGYLSFSLDLLICDRGVLEVHVALEYLIIQQVPLTHLAFPVLRI